MAKFTHDTVLEAALAKVATATRMTVTNGQPANFAGIAAILRASAAVTPGVNGSSFGPYADGDVSGRKIAVLAKSGISVSASGTADHVNLDDGTTLLHCTTFTSQSVTSGNTINVASYDVEFADVTP
jgi:hypothetical protein